MYIYASWEDLYQSDFENRAPDKKGIEDSSKIIFLISLTVKTYVVTTHYNCLDKTVLMMSHNKCFYGEIGIIIP